MFKSAITIQYRSKMDRLLESNIPKRPKEGWIRTMRKALGMSSSQLSSRLNLSQSQVTQTERMEIEDRITIKQLRRVAERLDCELSYAFIPRKPIEELVREQARLKACELVHRADKQMKLEAQQLTDKQLNNQIEIETERLMKELPRGLWD